MAGAAYRASNARSRRRLTSAETSSGRAHHSTHGGERGRHDARVGLGPITGVDAHSARAATTAASAAARSVAAARPPAVVVPRAAPAARSSPRSSAIRLAAARCAPRPRSDVASSRGDEPLDQHVAGAQDHQRSRPRLPTAQDRARPHAKARDDEHPVVDPRGPRGDPRVANARRGSLRPPRGSCVASQVMLLDTRSPSRHRDRTPRARRSARRSPSSRPRTRRSPPSRTRPRCTPSRPPRRFRSRRPNRRPSRCPSRSQRR